MSSYFDDRGRGPVPSFSFHKRKHILLRRTIAGLSIVLVVVVAWRVLDGDEPPPAGGSAARENGAPAKGGGTDGSAPGGASGTEPASLPPELQKLLHRGLPVYCGGGNEPLVALTFDDGPGPYTQDTIDMLQEHGAGATFFLAGKLVEPNAKLARREARSFEVANHSWSHFGLAGEPKSVLRREIDKPKQVIERETGQTVIYFRPPWGSRDRRLDRYVASRGMIVVMWSLESRDSQIGVNTDDIIRTFEQGISPGDIVLLHENRGTTRNALPELLAILEEKGLRPVTLTELLTQDPPSRQQLRSGDCS